jgi:hypothetical protein
VWSQSSPQPVSPTFVGYASDGLLTNDNKVGGKKGSSFIISYVR